ncbi:MAG TPA: RNA 3'-terminal phosphate cyclase [Methanoregulaceae archaeon]|nr:RNA 3'-terminal phosphate cyclase [Methanoregulaceae archaeon]
MLTLDGSTLEGGGQIVRSAVALSAITGEPVKIVNIRAGREKPGLRYQHCAAIEAVAGTCSAQVEGCEVGRNMVVFIPGSIRRKEITVDIGTAGSIPLVLHAWLPVILECGGVITLKGGTEVRFSPTIDYFEHVYAPVLRSHGAVIRTEILNRGYYPRGGGMVRVSVEPSRIVPLDLAAEKCAGDSGICSCSSNLPDHVAFRQAASANSVISNAKMSELPVYYDQRKGFGTGSSVTLWIGYKGACALGKPGLPAEKVGESAARSLIEEVQSEGLVDQYLSDQFLIYLARYGGRYSSSRYTHHARTMVWLLEQFGLVVAVREGPPVEFLNENGS